MTIKPDKVGYVTNFSYFHSQRGEVFDDYLSQYSSSAAL